MNHPLSLDVLPSASTSNLMNSEAVITSQEYSVFSRLSSSSAAQSSEFASQMSEVTRTEVAESASVVSSDTFSAQSQTTTVMPLGAVFIHRC